MRRNRAISHDTETLNDRPWVFFMVDCFFLITEFFILTFQFKVEESVLPHKLPPGSYPPGPIVYGESVDIHAQGQGLYRVMGEQITLEQLSQKLAALSAASRGYSAKVSYEVDVRWGEVMAVFDLCKRLGIEKCGLLPLRVSEIPGAAPRN